MQCTYRLLHFYAIILPSFNFSFIADYGLSSITKTNNSSQTHQGRSRLLLNFFCFITLCLQDLNFLDEHIFIWLFIFNGVNFVCTFMPIFSFNLINFKMFLILLNDLKK